MDTKYKYRVEIQQMMFVAGAASDPPLQTLIVVEDIVRAQVVELLNRGTTLARRRGARSISVEDVMFLIRHDTAKVNRLSTYLAWKDVRKNAREQDSGAAGGTEGPDILDDPAAALGGAASGEKRVQKTKRIGLPWKPTNMFSIPMTAVQPASTESGEGDDADNTVEAESDDEDSEATQIMKERLRNADLRTQNMTREEYVHWSECRQASFTFRKAKRFKEWAGLAQITDSRLQDDIMDVLGFLTFEIVANLTGAALKVKSQWESKQQQEQPDKKVIGSRNLFKLSTSQETPLLPAHVRAAYSQFEMPSNKAKALRIRMGGRLRYETKLI